MRLWDIYANLWFSSENESLSKNLELKKFHQNKVYFEYEFVSALDNTLLHFFSTM